MAAPPFKQWAAQQGYQPGSWLAPIIYKQAFGVEPEGNQPPPVATSPINPTMIIKKEDLPVDEFSSDPGFTIEDMSKLNQQVSSAAPPPTANAAPVNGSVPSFSEWEASQGYEPGGWLAPVIYKQVFGVDPELENPPPMTSPINPGLIKTPDDVPVNPLNTDANDGFSLDDFTRLTDYNNWKNVNRTPEQQEDASIDLINAIFGQYSGDGLGVNAWLNDYSSEAKTFNDGLIDGYKGDITNYFTDQLNDQKEKTDRSIKFTMARRGLSGGSADLDTQLESDSLYDKGVADIAVRANTATDNMRASDEQSRMNLISQIRNGMDQGNAMTNAFSQIDTNRKDNYNVTLGSQFGDAFGDLANVLSYNNYLAGENESAPMYTTRKNNFNLNYQPFNGR